MTKDTFAKMMKQARAEAHDSAAPDGIRSRTDMFRLRDIQAQAEQDRKDAQISAKRVEMDKTRQKVRALLPCSAPQRCSETRCIDSY